MKEFVQKIANGGFGLVSALAEQSIENNDMETFIDYLGQQSCIDAPLSMQNTLGEDLYNEIVELYYNLPEELRTYTTGTTLDDLK